ncbi:Tn3 family transposase [Candidatus Odyssella acanthamoebae]|uniref:Tn3 family transposase n=1 Tax=Candidatus Odyssella acanthamoebae TaxID=91604 RepID=UPI0022B39C97|nr:Tn3 family transposase [Candidatus Paracaedibacter acanthamoebae]
MHRKLSDTLNLLQLGHAGIRYYAGSVMRSQIFQIHQRSPSDRYIHALAFVAHQYYRMQDNLVDIFLNVMKAFQTTIANERKEKALEQQKTQHNQLQILIQNLEAGIFSVMQEIRSVANDNTLPDSEKVNLIKEALNCDTSRNIENIREEFLGLSDTSTLYDLQESKSLRLQNRISSVLKAVNLQAEQHESPLIEAIDYFRDKDGHITEQAPALFLDETERKALYREDGTFRVSLYKVFLFQHVAAAIKSGKLNLIHSYKYRPLNEYIISRQRWKKEKHRLLERAGLLNFLDSKTVLQQLDHALHEQYKATNTRARKNEYLSFKADGSFRIKTPPLDSRETDPLQAWFPKRHYIPLVEILETVHHHCDMLSAFEHWQQTHTSQTTSRPLLLAGIIGLGCGIGVRKMARISSHVSENELDHTVNWCFSLENIRESNDRVMMVMDKMQLPNIYRSRADKLHTASDGQKFEVRAESLLASRSFKYFGQGQGVSAYTFVDERHFLWHSTIISASDRESAYVIDGLMHNDVVKSDIHSTDTYGYSEAIFGITHMLGFSFAPRLKGLQNKQLYIFKYHSKQERKDWTIVPDHYVNEKLLHQNWDDFLRLVTTIKLKENSASDIFRRLNSYSKQHTLYQTIKAFGQIIKSLFILRYLDEMELRQAIEKQLNKVELSNRFTRAVAIGSPREFTQAEKEEQEVAEACNRLIRNCIICWNYLYLTHKLERMTGEEEKEQLLHIISSHSIMTWAHINMLGEYDFSEEKRKDSVGILSPKMAA